MGNATQDFKARNGLQFEEINRMAFRFAHHGNQNIQRLYCGFTGRLGMHHRPLDNALEAQGRLCFDRIQKMIGNLRRVFSNAGGKLLGQDFQIRTTQF